MDTNNYQDNNEAEATEMKTNQTYSAENYHDAPYFYQPEPTEKSIGLSVASMVLGIISLVFGCCFGPIALTCSLLAIIFGSISIHNHKGGKGMAIAGLVCGLITLAYWLIILAYWLLFLAGILDSSWLASWLDQLS